MQGKPQISRFTPSRTAPKILEEIFVQRDELLADTIERIQDSVFSENKHHLLFIGPRGCGKTHLISIINHRLQMRDDLKCRLRIAWLNEDETSTSFLKLLIRIYNALAANYPNEFSFGDLELICDLPKEQALAQIKQLLLMKIVDRTLIVLVENLDELFAGIRDEGQKRWRAFLQEHPVSIILGTAQRLFPGVSRRESPFFGTFQVEHLQPLSFEEATELLKRISKYHKQQDLGTFLDSPSGIARVRAVYHLSGGNHRVYIILSEFISRETLNELVNAFEKMLDELTPYYQERIRWLTPQQRELVNYLCRCEAPVPVKNIARRLFATHQTVSSQLKDLRDKGYVNSYSRGRESLYELAEPLMRLSIEVKENLREPIRLIIKFLRVWYTPDQLSNALTNHSQNYLTKKYITTALEFNSRAYERLIDVEPASAYDIKSLESRDSQNHIVMPELQSDGSAMELAIGLFKSGNFEKAIREFTLIAKARDVTLDQMTRALVARGIIHGQQGNAEKAIADYSAVLKLKAVPITQKAMALVWRGIAYGQQGNVEKAIADFAAVLKLKAAAIEHKAMALVCRGIAYGQQGNAEEAIADYAAVLEMDNIPDQEKLVALNQLAATHNLISQYELALTCSDQAIALDPHFQTFYSYRIESLLWLNRWQEGWKALKIELKEFPPQQAGASHNTPTLINIIALSTSDPNLWTDRIKNIVELYKAAGALEYLGKALVRSLESSNLLEALLTDWYQAWEEVFSKEPQLTIPIRIFRTGIDFLKGHDPKALYDLAKEEREILSGVLNIEIME